MTPTLGLLVCPSDHIIGDESRFHAGIDTALKATDSHDFITFGITPDRAETGFGYIDLTAPINENPAPTRSNNSLKNRTRNGRRLWLNPNGFYGIRGCFCSCAQFALDCFDRFAPKILQAAQNAVASAQTDTDFIRLSDEYGEAETISFDYAIAEKTARCDHRAGIADGMIWAIGTRFGKPPRKPMTGLVISPDTLGD